MLGMSVGRAKRSVTSSEKVRWGIFFRERRNRVNPTDLYLHDISWHLYQIRRFFSSGLADLEPEALERKVRWAKAGEAVPDQTSGQSVEAQMAYMHTWLG